MAPAVETRAELMSRVERNAQAVRSLGVRRLALFGSFARGEERPASDVDFLVEFLPGRKSFDAFTALATLLEDVLHRRVELVTPEALSPYIGPQILAEARDVLSGREYLQHIREELEYLDQASRGLSRPAHSPNG